MLIQMQRRLLLKYSNFNTSHVNVNRSCVTAMYFSCANFNTSHVNVNPAHQHSSVCCTGISIHLMLMLIKAVKAEVIAETNISIHLMLMLILSANREHTR